MTPERWQQVNDIFDRAVECDPASRLAFVRGHCGGDEEHPALPGLGKPEQAREWRAKLDARKVAAPQKQ